MNFMVFSFKNKKETDYVIKTYKNTHFFHN
jgi:hypothetical protein